MDLEREGEVRKGYVVWGRIRVPAISVQWGIRVHAVLDW